MGTGNKQVANIYNNYTDDNHNIIASGVQLCINISMCYTNICVTYAVLYSYIEVLCVAICMLVNIQYLAT